MSNKGREVIQVEAADGSYTNIVEYEVRDDDDEIIGYRYELTRWFYGSGKVIASWESKEQLVFETSEGLL